MKTAKIGAMFLVSVLALAGLGVGYAAWTDTITIEGTINTGNVDLAVRGYSGTWVWKVYGGEQAPADELYIWHGLVQDKPTMGHLENLFPQSTIEEISSAYARPGVGEEADVVMTFDNLFPCQDFYADVIFHYEGSIPAYVYRQPYIDISNIVNGPQYGDGSPYLGDNWMEDHWLYYQAGNAQGIWIDVYYAENVVTDPAGDPTGTVVSYTKGTQIFDPVQLHNCDCSGDFDLDVYAMQWNEFPLE